MLTEFDLGYGEDRTWKCACDECDCLEEVDGEDDVCVMCSLGSHYDP